MLSFDHLNGCAHHALATGGNLLITIKSGYMLSRDASSMLERGDFRVSKEDRAVLQKAFDTFLTEDVQVTLIPVKDLFRPAHFAAYFGQLSDIQAIAA